MPIGRIRFIGLIGLNYRVYRVVYKGLWDL